MVDAEKGMVDSIILMVQNEDVRLCDAERDGIFEVSDKAVLDFQILQDDVGVAGECWIRDILKCHEVIREDEVRVWVCVVGEVVDDWCCLWG